MDEILREGVFVTMRMGRNFFLDVESWSDLGSKSIRTLSGGVLAFAIQERYLVGDRRLTRTV